MTEETQDDLDDLIEGDTDDAEAETEDSSNENESQEEAVDAEDDAKGEESETPSVKTVPIEAYHDEKRKRQEYEQRVTDLQSQIPKADNAPDPFEDLDAYNAYKRQEWEEEKIQEQQSAFSARLDESRTKMLTEHSDYGTVETIFSAFAQQDPVLKQQLLNHADPAKFAYEKGKEFLAGLQETPNVTKPLEIPPSLATATAQGSNSIEVEKDEDLLEMFGDLKY